ncbi:hypothetical protein RJ639_003482 [Escallonia herrerae]|uniref:Uncharacterized protein n=1 Tax=Escallonia herrerae TaxID=1293975 RepID=A0AA88VZ19_9ASTE|nr:hypothetical protein RJ639_003482 [Escallonia herrerae]
MFAFVFLWFDISFQPVFIGRYVGFEKPATEDPIRTIKTPRQVPEQAWYMTPVFSILICIDRALFYRQHYLVASVLLHFWFPLPYVCHPRVSSFQAYEIDKSVYQAEEVSSKKFLVSNYMDFKMTDDRPVSAQVREFQLIANDICAAGMVLDENFHVGAIVAKLPPTWKEYCNKLKHKKEDLSLDQLMQHLHIEEETRNREKVPAKETIVKAHVVVDKDEKKNS